MSIELRIILIIVCVLVLLYVLKKIRQSKMNIIDSIFWIVFVLILMIISIFPQIAYALSALLGIQTPINFILLVIIGLLLLKVFLMSVRISQIQDKMKNMAQKIAYDEFEQNLKEKDHSNEL